MIRCFEHKIYSTESGDIIHDVSCGGSTTHVVLGKVGAFCPKGFPSALKAIKDKSNPCGAYIISHDGRLYNGETTAGIERVYSHTRDKDNHPISKDDLALYIYSSECLKQSTVLGIEWAISNYIKTTYGPDVASARVSPNQEKEYLKERDYIDPNIMELVPSLIECFDANYASLFKKLIVAHSFLETDEDDYIALNNDKFTNAANIFTKVRNNSKTIIQCEESGKVTLMKGSVVSFRKSSGSKNLRDYEKNKIKELQDMIKPYVTEKNMLTRDVIFNSYSQAVKACCGSDSKNTDATNADGMTYLEWRKVI